TMQIRSTTMKDQRISHRSYNNIVYKETSSSVLTAALLFSPSTCCEETNKRWLDAIFFRC
ncbi:hypothetical protein, partial [Legionella waltersii]|uniref:hypothetical protein n=1 Tax=Legionella waltersii TaxID=66969 RepID=UPI001EE7028A